MKRSKHGLFVFSPKKTLIMEKALFDWLIALQYDVKANYRLFSRKFSGMKFFFTRPSVCLKGHSQLWDRADLDTTFAHFEKRLPQPEIKPTRRIHVEICFNPA